jgi:hypothetical protein
VTSFDTLRVRVGRRPINVVELDLDSCARTYGTAPCTAAVGTTGSQKCFNTFKTCQDSANFSKTTKTYKFTDESAFLPVGEQIFPCIVDLDMAPTQLKADNLAVSASATITFKDFPHHDRGVDPYWADRTYDPQEQGTFFSKLRARNPYLTNRIVRISSGYIDTDRVVYTRTRTYFVDRIEGPDSSGRVRLVCKDILRFTDVEKSKAPAASRGTLSAGINTTDASLTLTPSGIGSEYAATADPADKRWLIIDDELVSYTTRTGDVISGISRAQQGTTAASHSAGATVQRVVVYNSVTLSDVAYDLLVNYAGVSASYITKGDWDTECSTWIGGFTITGVYIVEPTGVKELLEELLTSAGAAIWWDDEGAQLRLKVVVPVVPTGTIPYLEETSQLLQGSLKVRDLEKERVSRVLVYHNLLRKTEKLEKSNCSNITVTLDSTTEGTNAYGVSQSREIVSRWMPSTSQATDLGSRLLGRYKETPREFSFRLDAKDSTLKTGDLVDIATRLHTNPDGSTNAARCIVTEKREAETGSHYEYVAIQVTQSSGGQAYLITPNSQADWTSASASEKATYFFISNAAGVMSDLSPGAKIV